jgi:hypothetical protein
MTKVSFLGAGLAFAFPAAAFASEYPVTLEEEKYCDVDCRQYCDQDGLGSQLRAICMRQPRQGALGGMHHKALEDAGEVTPEEETELKKIDE